MEYRIEVSETPIQNTDLPYRWRIVCNTEGNVWQERAYGYAATPKRAFQNAHHWYTYRIASNDWRNHHD